MVKRWNLEDKSQQLVITNEILEIVEKNGFKTNEVTLRGPAAVSVHNNGTATLRIMSDGKTHKFELKLYPEGIWEIIQ